MKQQAVQRMTRITMLLAIAIIFQVIEGMIPIPVPLPGIKLGFANVVGVIALFMYGGRTMFMVNLSRVILGSLLRGIIFGPTFYLAFFGALFASCAMLLFKKVNRFSIIGISIAGAVFHVVGQIIVISYLYNTIGLVLTYLPWLLLVSIPAGAFTGYVAKLVCAKMHIKLYQ